MLKGFSLLEFVVALAISVGILSIALSTTTGPLRYSRRVIGHQQKMESIFHTIDMIRSDLTKCGMRLQEASRLFNFQVFKNSDSSFKVVYGLFSEHLLKESPAGSGSLTLNRNEYFQNRKKIVIYDPDNQNFEVNRIKKWSRGQLLLEKCLQYHYPEKSVVVVLKEVEYKLYSSQNALKRKVNRGYFQPIIEEVTGFDVVFYPEAYSVLYRIEVNRKEQIRGYIFLPHVETVN